MSSNFWTSSHCRYWLTTRTQLAEARAVDLQYATPHQLYCLGIWFSNLIQKLGKRLQMRQMPIGTANVFFRRFYLKNSYCETNPYLVLAACCFVAAKVEETPVHIKSVVTEAKLVFSEHGISMFPAEPNKLGEMEFYLLEDLDFHLVVFHPYRSLLAITGREPADSGRFPQTRVEEDQVIKKAEMEAKKKRDEEIRKAGPGGATRIADDLGEESEEARIRRLMSRGSGEGMPEVEENFFQICQFVMNDTYRTDIHLLYPPYMIALSVLYIGYCVTPPNTNQARTRSTNTQANTLASSVETNEALDLGTPAGTPAEFLASFNVSLPVLFACVQDIIALYPIWESFEPPNARQQTGPPGVSTAAAAAAVSSLAKKSDTSVEEDKFGPEQAEELVRRMIEERLVDVGHPDDAGEGTIPHAAGKKRPRH